MLMTIGLFAAIAALGAGAWYAQRRDTADAQRRRQNYVQTLFLDIVRLRDKAKSSGMMFAVALCDRAARAHDRGDYHEAEVLTRVASLEFADHGIYVPIGFEAYTPAN